MLRCGICPDAYPPTPDGRGLASGLPAGSDPDDFHTSGGTQTPDDISAKLATFLGKDRGSYIKGIIDSVFRGSEFKASPFCPVYVGRGPCLMELIWSYWHEEGMLVQTTNAIALRFQNVARHGRDPLAEFALDSLRPLSGFISRTKTPACRWHVARTSTSTSTASGSRESTDRESGLPTPAPSSSRRFTICSG